MIMILKTPGSQMGSPAAAEEGGEEVGSVRVEAPIGSLPHASQHQREKDVRGFLFIEQSEIFKFGSVY